MSKKSLLFASKALPTDIVPLVCRRHERVIVTNLAVAAFTANRGLFDRFRIECFDHVEILREWRIAISILSADRVIFNRAIQANPPSHLLSYAFGFCRMLFRLIVVAIWIAIAALSICAQEREIRINVTDTAGAAITNASVKIDPKTSAAKVCSSRDDAYYCPVPDNSGFVLTAEARGFQPWRIEVPASSSLVSEYVAVLRVAPIAETVVTVVRSETRISESPESISVLPKQQIGATAAPTLDDALRQIPGFSIFRRSSSRNANPTTQGVSLRGVGASGASRSVVMFDGVPLNDPFGGWVQWNRISPIAVESVEVLRGGASNLYGDAGLSGAVDVRPRTAMEKIAFAAEAFAGSQRTFSGQIFAGSGYKGWFGDISAGHFQTRGFVPVDKDERGLVDSFAGMRSVNLTARIGRRLGETGSVFFRPVYFGESRTNGTPAQINRTHSRQFVAGGDLKQSSTSFDWHVFGGSQIYDQTFSAVSADRSTESLTRLQRSPSQHFGYSGVVSTAFRQNNFIAGIEGGEVRGSSDEVGFANGRSNSLLGAGGRERDLGLFAKDVIRFGSRVVISGGLRLDKWSNFRALSSTTVLSSGLTATSVFSDRDESALSPHAAVLINVTDEFSFHFSASRSFRAPTLNELYRGFRVGSIVTNANASLRAEKAVNVEGGANFRKGSHSFRATAFMIDIDGAVSNVTISSTPSLITRQRQNAGKTRTAGIEIDAEARIGDLELNAGYLLSDPVVKEFPSNPALVGNRIPQVPLHQFTFQTRYPFRGWTVAFQGRASSAQFDDDLNQFRLEPYFQLDAFISKRFRKKIELFAAAENLLNSRYSVGKTPVRTVSSPFNVRAGIRWN